MSIRAAFLGGLRPTRQSRQTRRRRRVDPTRCDVCQQRISFCPYACGMCIACCPGHPEAKKEGDEDEDDGYVSYRRW